MLTQWLKAHPPKDILASVQDYHPYPKAGEAAWAQYPDILRNHAITRAVSLLGFDWPVMKATQFMEFFRSGSRKASSVSRDARRGALMDLVLGECFEGKGRFLDEIINGIWLICEESSWVVSAHNIHTQPHHILPDTHNPCVDLFAVETAGLLAWTRYLLRDQLDSVTPMVVERIEREINARIIEPFRYRQDYGWMGYTGLRPNNWTPWICSNMLSIVLTLEPNPQVRAELVTKMCTLLDMFIAEYGEDGGCDEGAHYWSRAGGSLYDCLDQLSGATGGQMDFFQLPLIREIGDYIAKCHIGGIYFVNFADGRPYLSNFCSSLVYNFGKRIENPYMMALGRQFFKPYFQEQEASLLRTLPSLEAYAEMEAYRGDVSPRKDIWMSDVQVCLARQAASYDGLYLAAKGGNNGESHNHNDIGSCIVFVDSQPGLIDLGVETYTRKTFSPERYSIWTMRSRFHNIATINGCEQLPGRQYRASEVAYAAQDDRVTFSLNIADVYPPEANIAHYARRYTFDRANPETAAIRIDDAYRFGQDDNALAIHFMTLYAPVFEAGSVHIAMPNGKVLTLRCDDAAAVPEIEKHVSTDAWFTEAWGAEGTVYRICYTWKVAREGSIGFSVKA